METAQIQVGEECFYETLSGGMVRAKIMSFIPSFIDQQRVDIDINGKTYTVPYNRVYNAILGARMLIYRRSQKLWEDGYRVYPVTASKFKIFSYVKHNPDIHEGYTITITKQGDILCTCPSYENSLDSRTRTPGVGFCKHTIGFTNVLLTQANYFHAQGELEVAFKLRDTAQRIDSGDTLTSRTNWREQAYIKQMVLGSVTLLKTNRISVKKS